MNPEDAVVVPLVPVESELTTEAMLRMLLNREALIITREESTARHSASGMIAQSSGAFAKAIGQTVNQAGRAASTDGLYRIVLPTGAVARDLVPAIGGGVRGLVRAAGSTKIAGHARFVPRSGGCWGRTRRGALDCNSGSRGGR